jgi:flagellar hook protein FlgE
MLLDDASDTVSIMIDGSKYSQSYSVDAATTLNKLSDQISKIKGMTSFVDTNTGELTIQSLIPGKLITIGDSKLSANNMPITNIREAVKGNGLAGLTSTRDALKKAVEDAGAEFLEITNTVDLSNQENLGLNNLQLKLNALNLSDSPFGDISVTNGNIYMKQDDNKFIIGRLITSTFNDNLSLNPQGSNLYKETKESGKAIFAGDITTIQNKTLELSNSDLSEGLVNLMVYQRSFEANSKSVTTSDDLLKTAIQLKK